MSGKALLSQGLATGNSSWYWLNAYSVLGTLPRALHADGRISTASPGRQSYSCPISQMRKLGLSQVTEGLCSRSPAEHGLGLGSEPRQSDSHQESDWSECHPSPPSQTLQSSASTFSPPALLFPTLLHPSTFQVAAMPLDSEVSPCLITTPPQTTHAVTWT